MNTSPTSSHNLPDQTRSDPTANPPDEPRVSRLTARPIREPGFGYRNPILFDHRDDMPGRELAHWGPATRLLFGSFMIAALVLLIAALVSIAWYTI